VDALEREQDVASPVVTRRHVDHDPAGDEDKVAGGEIAAQALGPTDFRSWSEEVLRPAVLA
jgi:hypothetical protein